MGLALLRPEQSLEGAPSPGAVWSHPGMLGWAGHLSLGQVTTASPGDTWAAHPAWSTEQGPAGTSCNGCPAPLGASPAQGWVPEVSPLCPSVPGRRDRDISKHYILKAQ